MAISFAKEEEKKEKIEFTTPLFWTLVFVLASVLVVWGILKIYNKIIDGKINQTKLKIQEMNQKKDTQIEQEMKTVLENYKKISPLINSHTNSVKMLDFLEQNRHPQVNFSNINYNFSEGSITFSATSNLPQYILEQEKVFQNKKDFVLSIEEEGNPSFTSGGVSVNFKIMFKKDSIHF